MADLQITPSKIQGYLTIPPSKSHTLRAILFGALAHGTSHITNYLASPDTTAMIAAVRSLGATVTEEPHQLTLHGVSGQPHVADDVIACGNSGLVLRLIGALAGLIPQYTILTGDHSIRHNRPVKPLLDGLQQLGAFATSSRGDQHAPILIKGPLTQRVARVSGQDSQPISALLIAAAFATHPIELHVTDPGEKPWIDLTLHWFKKLGIACQMQDYTFYKMEGSSQIKGFDYTVPGDFSTAAFPIVAALITQSELTLHNIDMHDIQGDKAIIPLLEQMGAIFLIDANARTLTVKKGKALTGMRIDINHCIDALPILAVIGCFANGKTEIVNAAIARKKESDRISAIVLELKKMGAIIEEHPDGLTVETSPLQGAQLSTYSDHRLALSLSIAAMGALSQSTIQGVECTAKTYPHFYEDFLSIGALFNLETAVARFNR